MKGVVIRGRNTALRRDGVSPLRRRPCRQMWRAMLLIAFMLLSPVHGRTAEEKESMKKAIRMKTTRQLKEIFDELEIDHKGLSKEELQTKAYKEDAIGRWETLHPEKKKKPRPASRGGGGGGGYGGMPGMEGMKDVPGMEDLMRQMRGDFSGEPDPEKRRILEKLAKKGMSFGGGNSMDLEQLKNMEMLDAHLTYYEFLLKRPNKKVWKLLNKIT